MKDIYENAKFGDKYVSRRGDVYVFIKKSEKGDVVRLISEYGIGSWGPIDGIAYPGIESEHDIVSKYKEEINEEELEKQRKADIEKASLWLSDFLCGRCDDIVNERFVKQFKKAMEE